MKKNLFISGIVAASLAGCGYAKNAKHDDQTAIISQNAQNLEVILTTDKSVYETGESPIVSVEIRNTRDTPILLVGSLDGSTSKARYPYCWFEVYDPQGTLLLPQKHSFCGNTNELRQEDFVLVQPHKTFNPYDKGFFPKYDIKHWKPQQPGTYRIAFNYSTNATNPTEWHGFCQNTRDYLYLINQVPKLELKKEIQIVVE